MSSKTFAETSDHSNLQLHFFFSKLIIRKDIVTAIDLIMLPVTSLEIFLYFSEKNEFIKFDREKKQLDIPRTSR